MNKYAINPDEGEILPNLLGLATVEEIAKAEFDGFLFADIRLSDEIGETTKFDIDYIRTIHKYALEDVYSFAGKYRQVNISKGGFSFPPARFLDTVMQEFNTEILNGLPKNYESEEQLIKDVAKVHGELLFIHPFREGNGRTARMLANLMVRKQGYNGLRFEEINNNFDEYVKAVQLSSLKNYNLMEKIISSIF